jgi:hypothetical protein
VLIIRQPQVPAEEEVAGFKAAPELQELLVITTAVVVAVESEY